MIDLYEYLMEFIEQNKEKETFKIKIDKLDLKMIKPSNFTKEVLPRIIESNRKFNIEIKVDVYDDLKNNALVFEFWRYKQ